MTPQAIIAEVCRRMGDVTPEQVLNRRRGTDAIVAVREACVYAMHRLARMSFPEIATHFRRGSHSPFCAAFKRAAMVKDVVRMVEDIAAEEAARVYAEGRDPTGMIERLRTDPEARRVAWEYLTHLESMRKAIP